MVGTDPLADAASLPELFTAVARRTPAAIALVDGDTEYSYAQLDQASDRLATGLAAHGVGPSDVVGVVAARQASTVVSILAVLRTGASYVPLDPTYPARRLRQMVEDAGVQVLVGAVDAVDADWAAGLTVLDPDAPGRATTTVVPTAAGGQDPAYVLYTSGSTGRPKGCVVTHANVLALLRATLPLFEVDAADRWSVFHSFSFDFSVWELWGAFATGATAVLVGDRAARSPAALLDLLVAEHVTVLNQVPSVFRYLTLAHAEADRPALAVRYLVLSGEAMDPAVASDFLAGLTGPHPVVLNMYGITEITVLATVRALTAAELAGLAQAGGAGRSPIGVALPHLEVSLRDPAGAPVAPGETGEIWVAGAGVAAGYLNRPELTAERFTTAEGRRWYRSGDLARQAADGGLEYAGRADDQVKVRGYRVELGEIEAVLRQHPLVLDAAVHLAGTDPCFLVASLVAADPPADLVARVRGYATGQLPRHLVPDRYRLLPRLPLTPSGKLDRRALTDQQEGNAR